MTQRSCCGCSFGFHFFFWMLLWILFPTSAGEKLVVKAKRSTPSLVGDFGKHWNVRSLHRMMSPEVVTITLSKEVTGCKFGCSSSLKTNSFTDLMERLRYLLMVRNLQAC
ncbi:hypothetical protein M758_12G010800 [Ceratodon purpureus]|nr:hypothetical protein M758_12G010800 [Ceratodon purpureus]